MEIEAPRREAITEILNSTLEVERMSRHAFHDSNDRHIIPHLVVPM